MEQAIIFRSKTDADDRWITEIAKKHWGSVEIVSRKHTYNILHLPSVIAEQYEMPVGFAVYAKEGAECEIVALYSAKTRQGIGTSLIDRVKEAAKQEGCTRVWLMTTNDNTYALRFYQKRGFVITAIRVNVMEEQRKKKPIPLTGNDGIPIRDEIELEIR